MSSSFTPITSVAENRSLFVLWEAFRANNPVPQPVGYLKPLADILEKVEGDIEHRVFVFMSGPVSIWAAPYTYTETAGCSFADKNKDTQCIKVEQKSIESKVYTPTGIKRDLYSGWLCKVIQKEELHKQFFVDDILLNTNEINIETRICIINYNVSRHDKLYACHYTKDKFANIIATETVEEVTAQTQTVTAYIPIPAVA